MEDIRIERVDGRTGAADKTFIPEVLPPERTEIVRAGAAPAGKREFPWKTVAIVLGAYFIYDLVRKRV